MALPAHYLLFFLMFHYDINSAIALPEPTGPYPVSFTDILDQTGTNGTFFRIYFPTDQYDSDDMKFPAWMEPEYFQMIRFFMPAIKQVPSPIPLNLPLLLPTNITKLPVVVFSHGLLLSKSAYSFMCSDIASYGYLVAAVDHKDGSAAGSLYFDKNNDSDTDIMRKSFAYQYVPFGSDEERIKSREQVEIRVQELTKVMDLLERLDQGQLTNLYYPDFDLKQFEGKLLLSKTAVMGHSHGGATALVSLIKEDRFKLAITQDPWMLAVDEKYIGEKIEKPILIINCIGEITKYDILKIRQLDSDITEVSAERLMVTLLGSTHFTQTDFGFFPRSFLQSINFTAPVDAKLLNTINTKLMLTVLRKHLNLTGDTDIAPILSGYQPYVIMGTDVEVAEAEILEAKKKVVLKTHEK